MHLIDNCYMLKMFVQSPKQLFCKFCKLVGHDEIDCQRYDLMIGIPQCIGCRLKHTSITINDDLQLAEDSKDGEEDEEALEGVKAISSTTTVKRRMNNQCRTFRC